MGELDTISTAHHASLPERWVEKIFRLMEGIYAGQWVDSLAGMDRERVKAAWGEDLAELQPDEIAFGLATCKTARPKWPPNVAEFFLLCRPQQDARVEFEEARAQMAIRLQGFGEDRWSRPEVYWAALTIGNYDLQVHAWDTLKTRWEYALASARHDPVPPWKAPEKALPAPGQQTVTRDDAQTRAAALIANIGSPMAEPGKGWALNLARAEAQGAHLEFAARKTWRAALGVGERESANAALARIERRSA